MKPTLPILFALLASSVLAADFHVATGGKDSNPGTREQPFATLERARDAARHSKNATVSLAAGTYRLTKTFELNEQDSGTTYRAAPGADVRLSGGVTIPNSAVKPVSDQATLARLVPEAKGKVMEIDLRQLGIGDFGEIGPRGFRRPYVPAPLELIVDGEPLALAQWPNRGQPGEPIGKVVDKGSVPRSGEKPVRGGTFMLATGRPARWAQAKDIWITGLFENGYADNTVRVKSIDLDKQTLTTVQPHMYGFSSGRPWNRWTALNLIEEIDIPGEFAADKASGKLYFLPPAGSDPAKAELMVTMLEEPMVAIEGATGVVVDGITFENARGMGIYIERGSNTRIQNCTLRNLGMVAVCIGRGVSPDPDYRHAFTGTPVSRQLGSWHEHIYDNTTFNRQAGTGHGVVNCHIYNIGEGAISLGGGDRKSLTPAGNFVENCDIHHFNRWDRTYRGAVNIDGVGNRVTHCEIHQAPALAIYLHGNEHVIEYNNIHHVMLEGDDMAAFYMGRDPTERGNVIRYNYWHHLAPAHTTWCLYFDDSGGDASQVVGNVFYRAGNRSTVFIPGGSDFTITNNLFIDCRKAVEPTGFRGDMIPIFQQRIAAVNHDKAPWAQRYPEFVDYWKKPRPHANTVKDNWVTNDKDPRFVDGVKGNFALKPGADTGIAGFVPIPFEKIGRRSPRVAAQPRATTPEVKTPAGDQQLGLTTGGSGVWKFYPAANPDPALPRVLLIGDSICNGYRGGVAAALKGKATVDVWLTPVAENDPGLHGNLKKVLQQGPYAVVHFNIGLHGWPKGRIPDGQYEPLMLKYVDVLRQHAPAAKIIWASSTPITVKGKPAELDPENNPTITTRNASAARIMRESGIAVNDLYNLVENKRAKLAAGDRFHWKAPAYQLMGRQIVESIKRDLPAKP
jgi:hypothetical protein